MPAAARVDDLVGHSSALGGFLAGAAVGLAAATGIAIGAAALASGAAALIVSGGLAAPLVAGALVTAGELAVNVVAGGYVMEKAEQMGESIGSGMTSPTGTIATGSRNVFINGKPAAFVTSKVACTMPGHQAGDIVAAGASRVFINGQPAARIGDLIVCGGKILSGSSNVLIGSPMRTVLPVSPEIPPAIRTAVFIASLLPAGGGLLRAVKPVLESVAEKGLTGSLKAGANALGRAMERKAVGNLPSKTVSDLHEMMKKAPDAKREIDALAEDVAKRHGGIVAKAPIKSEARALEKINNDYDGDASRIKDLARNTIIVPHDKIPDVVSDLASKGVNVKVIEPSEASLGYSGVNGSIKTSSGLTGEIQVNSPEMIYAKENPDVARSILGQSKYEQIREEYGVDGGEGHKMYEEYRVLPPGDPSADIVRGKSISYYNIFRRGQ